MNQTAVVKLFFTFQKKPGQFYFDIWGPSKKISVPFNENSGYMRAEGSKN
ncbi:MAG: hypothetical protein P8079_06160 [Gammaproteobacteria bacterium]|jgi:uncharacterized membrane protein YfbV (UPF0208 family)